MIVEVEGYAPARPAIEFVMEGVPDLERVFGFLDEMASGTAAFGFHETPSDNADVLLGVQAELHTSTRASGLQQRPTRPIDN